jgi:hypothetical protein
VGVNYEGLCCVALGALYYPIDGNELARDTRLYPIREILRQLEKDFGEDYSLMDYQPPLKQKYIILAEHTAIDLRDLNEILERLQRQLEARCYCAVQDRSYAESSMLCQTLNIGVRRSKKSKDVEDNRGFLVANFVSVMDEPGRVAGLDSCKRLANKDADLVLAAACGLYPLEKHDYTRDPADRSRIESSEQALGASYT